MPNNFFHLKTLLPFYKNPQADFSAFSFSTLQKRR